MLFLWCSFHLEGSVLVEKNQLSCDDNATYTIDNYQGNLVSAQPVGATGFSWGNFTFDPAQGTFTFQQVSYSNYQGFGSFEVELILGGQSVIVSGKVAECCQQISYDYLYIDEPIQTLPYQNATIITFGTCTFQNTTTLDFCTVYSGVDAVLDFNNGAETIADNSTLFTRFCNPAWDQIRLDNSSQKMVLSASTVEESIRGVHSSSNGEVEAVNAQFVNNIVSLYVENHQSLANPPYQGSFIKFSGCQIDFTRPMNTYNIDAASPIDPGNFFPGSCSLLPSKSQGGSVQPIYVGASDQVNIGQDNYSTNTIHGETSTDEVALVVDQSQVFIENNTIKASADLSLCSSNNSKVNVGGSTSAHGNNLESDIELSNSSLYVENNTIGLSSAKLQATITEVEYTDPNSSANVKTGGEIINNTFQGSSSQQNSFIVKQNSQNSYLRVYNNDFNEVEAEISDFKIDANDNTKRAIFHTNDLDFTGNSALAVEINNCKGMTFADNTITGMGSDFDGTTDKMGIKWIDTEDVTFYGNFIEEWNRGLQLEGDNSNTQLECNEFQNNYYSIFLNDATISDQGSPSLSSENLFLFFYAPSSNPYSFRISGSTSQTDNSTWYVSPSDCTPPQNGTRNARCIEPIDPLISNLISQNNPNPVNGCSKSISSTKISTDNFAEIHTTDSDLDHTDSHSSSTIEIFPNPFNSRLGIENIKKGVSIEILSLSGQVIIKKIAEDKVISLNLVSLEPGIYIIRVGEFNRRIIKL